MQLEKNKLRTELKLIRANIENREEKDQKITNNFFKLKLEYENVLVFIKHGTEVDTTYIIDRLLKMGIRVYAPKCDNFGNMEFFRLRNFCELVKGKYNILEPSSEEIFTASKAICLVPGLGFTKKGERIGYGMGYYDKFLEKSSAISICLCYNEQIIEYIPTDIHDKKMDYIVSDIKEVKIFG